MQISLRKKQKGKSYGLVPDYFADSVADIDFNVLRASGVRFVALDVDQTLTHHNGLALTKELASHLNHQVTSGVIEKIFLASNSHRDLNNIADSIKAEIVRASWTVRKPRRSYFRMLLQSAGCRPHEIVMIGDKLLTDILGGNRSTIPTVLVTANGPYPLLDRLIRRQYLSTRYIRRHKI